MDRKSKDLIAALDEDALNGFVRSSPQELEPAELDRVAGGAGVIIDPNG